LTTFATSASRRAARISGVSTNADDAVTDAVEDDGATRVFDARSAVAASARTSRRDVATRGVPGDGAVGDDDRVVDDDDDDDASDEDARAATARRDPRRSRATPRRRGAPRGGARAPSAAADDIERAATV
jgi:hypothetical protein